MVKPAGIAPTSRDESAPEAPVQLSHYRILRLLGAGGMGEVYLARDARLRREVAVKVLSAAMTGDEDAVQRFIREAHAASALNHPNILTIYDIGEQDNIHFIATEFVDGQTLRQRMQLRPLELAEILNVTIQIAGALGAAHGAGIVHRDIKPENIMIRTDGYVKVLDFGIAKLSEHQGANESDGPGSETDPGLIIGTVQYMSPEQARGLNVDGRSDIFSLGAMLFELVAGERPFSGATVGDLIAGILTRDPAPLVEFVKGVPLELEWAIARSLRKDREERYHSAAELETDLKRLQQRLDRDVELKRTVDPDPAAAISTILLPLAVSEPIVTPRSKTRPRGLRLPKAIDSLAVLPFTCEVRGSDADFLSDGIAESIINSLSLLSRVRVVPRSTVFRFKGRATDPTEIGRELGVRAVFTGRVQQVGEAFVITTELIDVSNRAQIWGEQYRRRMTDIFALQEEIAETISEKLKLKLTGAQKKQLRKRYTLNAEAYQYYLKGRYFVVEKRTEDWIKKGIEYFQRAIDLDPNYALAYSGIAEAYGFLASSTGGWEPRLAYPKSQAAAEKAVALDDGLAEAHCSLGFSLLLYDWDLPAAEREFLTAIRLNPNFPTALDGYGFYLKAVGRHDDAIAKCKEAQRIDPLSTFAHVSLGYAYYFARDFDRAIDECGKALEMDKYSTFAHRCIGLSLVSQEKFEEAIAALSKALTFSNGALAFESPLGYAYGRAGQREKASEVLKLLQDQGQVRYVSSYDVAMVHLGLGEPDQALNFLDKAFVERSGFMPFLNVEPMVDGLRGDSRFRALLQRVGVATPLEL